MSKARAKGTAWETDVCQYLSVAFPHVKRTGSANFGGGDIDVAPGVVIECKSVARIDLASITDQVEEARRRNNADIAAAWIKRRGRSSAGFGYVVMTGDQFTWMLSALIEVDEDGRP